MQKRIEGINLHDVSSPFSVLLAWHICTSIDIDDRINR